MVGPLQIIDMFKLPRTYKMKQLVKKLFNH